MPYYKDTNSKLHFLDDAGFVHMLPVGCVEISDDEAAVLQAPPPLAEDEIIKQQIAKLEATITPRRQREAILGIDNGWLADVNAQIATLRAKLK
jgi:hypothetical protein